MKYLGRMMRVWAGYCSVPISGMLIDTLAYQFIENLSVVRDFETGGALI